MWTYFIKSKLQMLRLHLFSYILKYLLGEQILFSVKLSKGQGLGTYTYIYQSFLTLQISPQESANAIFICSRSLKLGKCAAAAFYILTSRGKPTVHSWS
jgi:hypothetical protein